jgi:hypothetical protein
VTQKLVLFPALGSVPEATVTGEVESVAGDAQLTSLLPGLKSAVQVMVTAETGMVVQLEKVAPAAYT